MHSEEQTHFQYSMLDNDQESNSSKILNVIKSRSLLVNISLLLLLVDLIVDFRAKSISFMWRSYEITAGFGRSVQSAATVGLLCPVFGGGQALCMGISIITGVVSSNISIEH